MKKNVFDVGIISRRDWWRDEWELALEHLEHHVRFLPCQMEGGDSKYIYERLIMVTDKDDAKQTRVERQQSLVYLTDKIISFCGEIMPSITTWDEIWETGDTPKMKIFWQLILRAMIDAYANMFNSIAFSRGSTTRVLLEFVADSSPEAMALGTVYGCIYDNETEGARVFDFVSTLELEVIEKREILSGIHQWTKVCCKTLPRVREYTLLDNIHGKKWNSKTGHSNLATPIYLQSSLYSTVR